MFSGNPFWIHEREGACRHREQQLRVENVFRGLVQIHVESHWLSRILRIHLSSDTEEQNNQPQNQTWNALQHGWVLPETGARLA
jgi:hypothetical protein